MTYPTTMLGTLNIDLLQTYYWWYWYSTRADMSINQVITSKAVTYSSVEDVQAVSNDATVRKVAIDGRLYIKKGDRLWTINGIKH